MGLGQGWKVVRTEFEQKEQTFVICVEETERLWPEESQRCGQEVSCYDHVEPMQWRHLNVFNKECVIVSALPRGKRKGDGTVYRVTPPWEGRSKHFTKEFEAFALTLTREMPVKKAGEILGETDQRLWRMLHAHVAAARARADWSEVVWVGADEMNRRKGHNYVTVFADLVEKRVLFGVEGNHPIYQQPFQIDCTKTVRIPTPADFRDEIKATEIDVLPLVHDIHRTWNPGWSTHARDFALYPDVEYFTGGVNHQTPTSAALWRQGNLLHFGFEQSPMEMNELGQKLLLNSIAYISHFTEDRPIAVTPSVFAGEVASARSRSKLPPQERQFLHPDENQKLVIDEDLKAIGRPFDQPQFFEKTIAALKGSAVEAERARRLLERYVPCGPKGGGVDQWTSWWQGNRPYLFASDAGDYCWYIDPLARKRGIPTAELRGSKRADSSFLAAVR